MNKKTVWIAVVVVVVIVAGLAWWFMGKTPSAAPGSTVAGTETQSGSATPTSLKALFAAGTSEKCTVQNSDNGANSSGVVYVASGHMRGDFTSQSSGGATVESHMITDGTTSWVWTDQTAQGMKMSFTATSSMQMQGSAQQSDSINPDEAMNYSCSGWTPDQSEFTVPTNITFSDMSQMMNAMGAGASAGAGATTGGNSAMCTQCNQIQNASGKASCLAALGCK